MNSAGTTVATRQANSLGGLLFRNVPPGSGYRVRPAAGGEASGPLTVLSTQPAPPSTAVYNQTIPSSGYGYLTTRDGTKLSIVRAPAAGRDEGAALPPASSCRRSPPGPLRP